MANILCIDIGGTRIKAAILNDNISIEDLKNTNVKVIETLGWMNSSLPQIINKNHWASLTQQNESLEHYDAIALGVPFKVTDNGSKVGGYYIDQYGVPSNLMEAIRDQANCEIRITNDSIAWMHGALNYYQLCSIPIKFPCLAVILGSGVGLAYSNSHNDFKNIGASEQNHFFSHLSDASNENVDAGWRIHDVLGEKFFRSVKDNHKKWTCLKIQDKYTKRFIGLFKDIEKANLFNYKDVGSIIIGGGYSKYLCLSSLKYTLDKSIHMLNQGFLQVTPDVIPLLGLI